MTANAPKHLEHPVTLTLELDELVWLRAFLKKERDFAEIDHQEVERLHNDVATRAAKVALNHELDRMSTILDTLDAVIAADDAREAIAKRLAATLPAEPLAA